MSVSDPSPKSAFPTFIIVGVVVLSVILFFAFTLPYFRNKGNTSAAGPAPADPATTAAAATPAPDAPPTSAGPDAPATVPPAAAPMAYARPDQLIGALAQTLKTGNLDAALAIVGSGNLDAGTSQRFETLVNQGRYRIAEENPFAQIGRIDTKIRYSLNFDRPAAEGLTADTIRVLVDVDRDTPSAGWLVTDIHIPTFSAISLVATGKDAGGTAAAAPDGAPGTGTAAAAPGPGAAPAIGPGPILVKGDAAGPIDPLMLAHEFVEAVLSQDFAKARSLVDHETITEEKLAGLFIVAEEGGFARKLDAPLVATGTRDGAAWVIAQMANAETGADFGLEIVKATDGSGGWKIAGLNLDSLLLARSKMADVDDITYAPIIKNPKGGDSLVLYFEYDTSGLHPRAARQLQILAGILKADPDKTIMVGGHADAKGPDDYNTALSRQRASEVRSGLLAAGVSPSQIVTQAFGESQPLSPNVQPDGSDNPTGRKRNRRAEVYLNF